MTTLYIDKTRLDELVRERDEREKRWWDAHPSSLDYSPEAYVAGHQWAATEAPWIDLEKTFIARFAAENLALQPISYANDALGPFAIAAARCGLIDARKGYADLSDNERRSLRLFIDGAHGIALLVIKNAEWAVADIR